MSRVETETVDSIRIITMINEGKLNAFDVPMLRGVRAAIEAADADDQVRVIILTGGGTAFCTGGDITTFGQNAPAEENLAFLTDEVHPVPHALRSSPKPTIAMINGAAIGAGLDIALACDMRFCVADAKLAEGYIRAGLAAGDGGAWLLPRMIGMPRAMDLLLSGRRIDPQEALSLGLVNQVVAADVLREATLDYARSLARNSPAAVRAMKRLVQQSMDVSFENGMQLAAHSVAVLMSGDEHRAAIEKMSRK